MADEYHTTLIDLIRHGEPEGGPMFRGSKDDPLSTDGWAQMRAAIGDNERWDAILTSPMKRCHAFATELAGQLGVPLHEDDRLREISFGDWEGLTAEAIGQRFGRDSLTRFWADAERYPPQGGEPFSAFQARVQAAWQDWTGRLAGQRVLLVCHGGVIRVVLGHVMGIHQDRVLSAMAVPYACRSRVRIDHSGHGTLSCLVAHGSH